MNMYLEHGLEYTKKFDDMLVRVSIVPHGGIYLAIVTAIMDDVMVIEAKIRIEEEDVSLHRAETLAVWASKFTAFTR